MNKVIEQQYPLFRLYERLRDQLLHSLTDEQLSFNPGGDNVSLGRLCVEIGEVQQAYIDSFRTRRLSFDYRHPEGEALAGSVSRLREWYVTLNEALFQAVDAWSDEDVELYQIERGGGFNVPAGIQLEIFKEALLIFYGRADVAVKAMGITPSEQWRRWLG